MSISESRLKAAFLIQRQNMPLSVKIEMMLRRIRHWYELYNGNVYVSFSGGADSTVLLWFVRTLYPDVPAVFVDTGMEWPEIRAFVRTVDNVVWLKPKLTFKQVCEQFGYPVVDKETSQKIYEARTSNSEFLRTLRTTGVEGRKRQEIPDKWKFLVDAPFKISDKCCYHLKKAPMNRYQKETGRVPYVGTMAAESSRRTQTITEHGCFLFGKHPQCRPMSFWLPEDTHALLQLIPHCILYDPPYNFKRTGCFLCGFGAHLNCPNKFQMMKVSHPRLHEKAIPAFGLDTVLDFVGVPYQ